MYHSNAQQLQSPQPRKSTRSTLVQSQKTSCCTFPSWWHWFEFLSWGKWWEFLFHECFLSFKCLMINLCFTLCNCTAETALVGQCKVSVAWEGLPYEKLCDCVWDSLAVIHTLFSNSACCGQCCMHYPVKCLALVWCQLTLSVLSD